jgi:hypothetical protein
MRCGRSRLRTCTSLTFSLQRATSPALASTIQTTTNSDGGAAQIGKILIQHEGKWRWAARHRFGWFEAAKRPSCNQVTGTETTT